MTVDKFYSSTGTVTFVKTSEVTVIVKDSVKLQIIKAMSNMTLLFFFLFITFHFRHTVSMFSRVVLKESDSRSHHQLKNVKGKGNMSTHSHSGYII